MEVSDEALIAAMRKAVDVGLFPKHGPQEHVEENWQRMREILMAAKEADTQ